MRKGSYILIAITMSLMLGCEDNDPDIIRANFQADKQIAVVGEDVTFYDYSQGVPDAWEWTFEGATPSTSTDQHPIVKYNSPGVYTVELIASNKDFSDSERKIDYILVGEKLAAKFNASDSVINTEEQISFNDVSDGVPTSWLWTVDGGSPGSSTQPNVSAFFTTPGIFDISLKVKNAGDSSTIEKPASVRVMPGNGLIAQYDFNGESEDKSGNNLDAITDGPVFTEDRYGNENQAYYFDGIDDFIQVENDVLLENQNYTVSVWVNANELTGSIVSFSNFNGNLSNCGYNLIINEGFPSGWSNIANADWAKIEYNEKISAESWHFLAFTYDGENIKFYVDGELVASEMWIHNVNYEEHNPLLIGAYATPGGSNWFKGALDDLRIYNRALTADHIEILSKE